MSTKSIYTYTCEHCGEVITSESACNPVGECPRCDRDLFSRREITRPAQETISKARAEDASRTELVQGDECVDAERGMAHCPYCRAWARHSIVERRGFGPVYECQSCGHHSAGYQLVEHELSR